MISMSEPRPPLDPKRNMRALGYALIFLGCIIGALSLIGGAIQLAAGNWLDVLQASIQGLIGTAIFAGLPIILGSWLVKRAGRPPAAPVTAPAEARTPMSAMRLVFAVFGILVMLFAGGCGLLFMGSYVADLNRSGPDANFVGPGVVLIFAGPPFLAGLLIWWLAARVGRR